MTIRITSYRRFGGRVVIIRDGRCASTLRLSRHEAEIVTADMESDNGPS